jgi:outer membrane lipoprotein SlyB
VNRNSDALAGLVIGGALGAALGGPIGAVLGGVVGAILTGTKSEAPKNP